jgi:hypothetical protein
LLTHHPGQNRDGRNQVIAVKAGNGRDEAVKGLHSDKRDVRFQENMASSIDQGALPGLFPPRYGRSAPICQSASSRCLETFLLGALPDAPEYSSHWSPKSVFNSVVLPARVNLFH